MTSGKADEEFFRARGFGVKIGFGERPALILIDMIKGFTNPDMPLGAPLESQIEAQKPLIDVAHERIAIADLVHRRAPAEVTLGEVLSPADLRLRAPRACGRARIPGGGRTRVGA